MPDPVSRDFREVSAALQGAVLTAHRLEIDASRFSLGAGGLSLEFLEVSVFRWQNRSGYSGPVQLSIVGLERLAAEEPWRLYLGMNDGSELELSCGRITCNGAAVTGVGRSYRH